ncbi:MAG: bifunctional 3'-5' exonuclease/DNA polymerase [Microbacterium sp. 69-7]|uniref:bifunctional 3'-5' exonuclease/DNA polymerase n=1 Tax=unclassified Microbacterium TaxID=2609290 RepID=UPI00044A4CFB|nr:MULTISPECIES: bifunctional 3'-5' exonuclease/DNA polymerase [unclassified Microbacterium]EXJ52913.1 3'-5' exonuclease [Microbacterium sp. MRS-1]ODT24613.1 MAG: bifunctional 3'-5' exonuclease/DNA polymerase [Microbacterium sp. SCN 69-37]OJU43743.1 MAG: bifunctional 3'-5' exonuclease/DNA polymerase [Microbacterium sp. 69-7]
MTISSTAAIAPRWRLVAREGEDVVITTIDADLDVTHVQRRPREGWWDADDAGTRWVWSETNRWYPGILATPSLVARCHDLRLAHAILRRSALVADANALRAATQWDVAGTEEVQPVTAPTLFDVEGTSPTGVPDDPEEVLAEFRRQQLAIRGSSNAARLRLLVAAESAGALLAVEMHSAGLPWDRRTHERILEETLGTRPPPGEQPERVREAAARVRAALQDPTANLDSQPKLLRSLHRVGISADSTSRWELAEYDHPAIAPLLVYKKLTRLMSANGWGWLDEWAPDGRFRPVYVPGGVVTGRWASSGGGALQIPRQLRPAVRADPGWTLVVADVAQLEPRVLAAMSSDEALAAAARGQDLYEGIVNSGVVHTRQEAKIAVLGAMYGATTGDSGRLVPALRRAYPRAMGLVDAAAATGEQGGVVSTWLGRTSPRASAHWRDIQAAAALPEAAETDRTRARRAARDRGRFTRNFVVQGTAAEWALAWLADLRGRLAALPSVDANDAARNSAAVFERRPHLAFFLHDEIIVHTPVVYADAVADAVRQAADGAARLLFGGFPIDFPLDLRVAQDAAKS